MILSWLVFRKTPDRDPAMLPCLDPGLPVSADAVTISGGTLAFWGNDRNGASTLLFAVANGEWSSVSLEPLPAATDTGAAAADYRCAFCEDTVGDDGPVTLCRFHWDGRIRREGDPEAGA